MSFASIRFTAACAALSLACSATPSLAQTAQHCLGVQLANSGSACIGVAKCYVKAMKKGTAVDPACISKRATVLATKFATEEALANCLLEGGAGTVSGMIDSAVDSIGTSLTLGGGKCAATKMIALGKECKGFFRCNAKAAAASDSVDPACLAAHQGKATKGFTKAEAKFTCATTGDQGAREGDVSALVDGVFTTLLNGGTTTTTPVSSTSSTAP